MDTALIVLLTAVVTAFGTKLVEQIFKEFTDAREKRKGREKYTYTLERRISQLIVVAEHFRNIGVRSGINLDEYDLPDEFDGWSEPLHS